MSGSPSTAGPSGSASSPEAVEVGGAFAAIGVGLGSVLLVFWTPLLETPFAGSILFVGALGGFALAYRFGLHREAWFLATWVGIALALAVASALTGYLNGVTDEPYGTPAFVHLLPNLYGGGLHLSYDQYGTPSALDSAYIYLPLLTFIQVPGLDYRWLMIGAWLAILYLVRTERATFVLFAGPAVGLLAAEGFNDFVPLLGVTLTLVTLSGWRSRVAEVVSLGLKQFANVIVVLYYAWHRRWSEVALAGGITAAILLPFAVLSPSGVVCHALLLNPSPTCASGGGAAFVAGGPGHLNYYLWPLYGLAVFGARYVAELRGPGYAAERAAVERWRGRRPPPAEPASRARDGTVLLAPFVRVWSRFRGDRRGART
jgi:hypothetical protein